jgi:hypothetical protein
MRGAVDGGERTRLVVVRSFEGGWSHDILEDYPALSEVRSMIYGVRPGRHAMELADAPNPNWNWIPHASLIMSPLESDGANHYYWDKTGWHKVYVGL